jgi:hypothetical protein
MNSSKEPAVFLDEAERLAANKLDTDLHEHGILSESLYNLIGKILDRGPRIRIREVSQSRKACSLLLGRLVNDHRCAALAALRGYAEQACTLAASVYEAAVTIAAVGSDDSTAQAWIDHDDPNHFFRDIFSLTVNALEKLGVCDAEVNARSRYLIYRQLCLVKHLNPLFMKGRGYEIKEDQVVLLSGPDVSHGAIRIAQFALEQSSGMAFIGAAAFMKDHLAEAAASDLAHELSVVNAELLRLKAMAAQRWGTENPFPKHWRL